MNGFFFIILLLVMFIGGYYLMTKLDNFLDINSKKIHESTETQEPSCVLLTEDMPIEELMVEIQKFRDTHDNTRVIIYDSSDMICQCTKDN